MSFAGKTAVVTGGSRGIGLMIARGFVEGGARVYVSSRKAEVCQQVADELRVETISAVSVTGGHLGAGLGVAGALMQTLTRNPLADPGLLGVNAGSAEPPRMVRLSYRPPGGAVSVEALQREWDFFRERGGIGQDLNIEDHVIDELLPSGE